MSEGSRWTHTRPASPTKQGETASVGQTCTKIQLHRKRGSERDATQRASGASTPTEAVSNLTLPSTLGVYGSAPQGSNQSSPGTPLLLLGVACQEDVFRAVDPFMISTADVHRAHCYADAVRDVYVQLLDEDRKSMEQGACGHGSFLEAGGFSQGMAPPSPFSTRSWKFATMTIFSSWAERRCEIMHWVCCKVQTS